jgi:hypothetical protein
MLFSAWQATTHAWHLRQAPRSIDIPQALPGYARAGKSAPVACSDDADAGGAPASYSESVAERAMSRPSIVWWSFVMASDCRRPVFTSAAPDPIHGSAAVRSA